MEPRHQIGHCRLAGPAPPHQRHHRAARHDDVEVADHRLALAILELDALEPDLAHHRGAPHERPGRSGLSASIASTSNTRSIAASERCSSENELTMFQTGLSSRNVYHWKAMISPTEARPETFR